MTHEPNDTITPGTCHAAEATDAATPHAEQREGTFDDPREGTYNHAERTEVTVDETGYQETTRDEVAVDETGYRGVTRGVVHTDQPPIAPRD